MIAYVRGVLTMIAEESIVVETGGVGYDILCADPYMFQDQLNNEIRVFTYHYIREDAQTLFGFKKKEDKQLFAQLLNVSGIGPKGALAILGSVTVREFVTGIEQEDEAYLTKFPGVGKKTARQMILDLKGKLVVWLPDQEHDTPSVYTQGAPSGEQREAVDEALEALKALGYTDKELKRIRPELVKATHANSDDFIRQGLQLLMKN
ncbi:Holliday junction branch migration protein RuvA [Thalassobacillus sp. CUG 92003]|uniref:Holliday junction branch migration protein RuvA n=1 Tax=Thalassobacillus sp. CUG 92003 TaxID=2736641 RepID=UPI0015E63A45|nr:Holliday junction branch migration protein RuvA [Thalassobacillus sp. CUG 92003]